MSRLYAPIWNQLKQTGKATLIAPILSHKRIVQAVRKERSYDMGWKLLSSEENKRYRLQDISEVHNDATVGTLTLYLVDITVITVADL